MPNTLKMSITSIQTLCPCGSKNDYDDCCGLYISSKKTAPTPEALMRSRYSAYTQANIPYIQATMCDRAAEQYDPIEAAIWAKSVQWQGLQVLAAYPHAEDPRCGYVSFIASYTFQGHRHQLKEVSAFSLRDGKWYYIGMKEA